MRFAIHLLMTLLLLGGSVGTLHAQDRLKNVPGHERFEKLQNISAEMRKNHPEAFYISGAIKPEWTDDGQSFEYNLGKQRFRYDLSAHQSELTGDATKPPASPKKPARGRQYTSAVSPDRKWEAFYKDQNVWLRPAPKPEDTKAQGTENKETAPEQTGENTTSECAVTIEGNAEKRLKFGTASWVYGEELKQDTAMWWSPDSKRLAFYRFDEANVNDYFLTDANRSIQNSVSIEPYPKPGTANPVVDVLVYNLETRETLWIKVRDGKPMTDDVLGHYVCQIRWSPDGSELLFNRTNRWQNITEICAANPDTGDVRVVVRDEWMPSWTEYNPEMKILKDGRRFILASDRTGWRNYYLYDLSGKLIAPLTGHNFDCAGIQHIDEEAGVLYYMARSGDNHMLLQLHRVGLDGKDDTRLTYPALNHTVYISPDSRHILDVTETHSTPPSSRLLDREGRVLATVTKSDLSEFGDLSLPEPELIEFTAADGKTTLHGMLLKPSNFDPDKKYPLLVHVYSGPGASSRFSERFWPSSRLNMQSLTELGFLVVAFDARSVDGRGKRLLDSVYQKLGIVEIDDQAAGVKYLLERPYVDGSRVGVYGISYGGYASLMCLLRYPDIFHAACASSSVTDWRNYDTIYTERYMRTPELNQAGYDAGNVLKYVDHLRGRLMIFYGTADNNVHQSNSIQLIAALKKAGKSCEMQVGPDEGHVSLPSGRMMEFFVENLVMPLSGPAAAGE